MVSIVKIRGRLFGDTYMQVSFPPFPLFRPMLKFCLQDHIDRIGVGVGGHVLFDPTVRFGGKGACTAQTIIEVVSNQISR
jgi:hypothetical protein